jgi:hypothetical protein
MIKKEGDIIQHDGRWKCSHCGDINESYYLNCMNCASFRKDQKRKQEVIRLTSS